MSNVKSLWDGIPTPVFDEVSQVVYDTIMSRRGAGIPDSAPLAFLTNVKKLDGTRCYNRVLHWSPGAKAVVVPVQPAIHGGRLELLVSTRARVPVDGSDLDLWHRQVESAVEDFRWHLAEDGLIDLMPDAEDIAIETRGPDLVLLRWEPRRAVVGDVSPRDRLLQGYQWDWKRPSVVGGCWTLPSGVELIDPLRLPASFRSA